MIPLPDLSFGYNPSTRGGDVDARFEGSKTGGLNFGSQSSSDIGKVLMVGGFFVAVFLIARKVLK